MSASPSSPAMAPPRAAAAAAADGHGRKAAGPCLWRRALGVSLWALGCGAGLATAQAATAAGRVQLDDFAIDRTEVSMARFAEFVAATGLITEAERQGGGFEFLAGWQRQPGTSWRRPDPMGEADPQLPAVHLNFAEARAFCQWAGGDLPTAAQWRQAAFTEQRAQAPAPFERGRRYDWPTGESPAGANTSGDDPWARAAPVGATRAGVNGLHDMGANVWEWTLDARGDTHQTVGGSWWYPAYQMAADVQAFKPADFYAVYIGFRCVYPKAS